MPLMLLSNPGLSLAVLGNPKRGHPGYRNRKFFRQAERRAHKRLGKTVHLRGASDAYYTPLKVSKNLSKKKRKIRGVPWSGVRGTFKFSGVVKRRGHSQKRSLWTNPLSLMRNPMSAVSNYVGNIKAAIPSAIGISKKPRIKSVGFALAGTVGTYVASGLLAANVIVPALNKIPTVANFVGTPMGKRVLGASLPLLIGAGVASFVKGENGKAILAGSVVAAALEAIKPGMLVDLLSKLPVIGDKIRTMSYLPTSMAAGAAAAGGTNGLNGLGLYTDAASYSGSGVGAFRDVPGMDTTGHASGMTLRGDALAAYVEDKAQRLTAGNESGVQGVDGYLREAEESSLISYLNVYPRQESEETTQELHDA